jgi:hypothetical protein
MRPRAKLVQKAALVHLERRSPDPDPLRDLAGHARASPAAHVSEEQGCGLEPMDDVEVDLVFEREEALANGAEERGVGLVGLAGELALVQATDRLVTRDDLRVVRPRTHVEEDAAGHEAPVDSPQGVDHALGLHSSQGV